MLSTWTYSSGPFRRSSRSSQLLPFVGLENLLKMGAEGGLIRFYRMQQQGGVDQAASFNAQLAGKGKVGLQDAPLPIGSDVADRGKLIEIGIFFQRFAQLFLGHAEFLVLHLQFDLMHLQFVDKSLAVLAACCRKVPEPLFTAALLRKKAQLGKTFLLR